MKLTGEFPNGPTQHRWWSEGYQAAMRDIRAKLDEEGPSGVDEWLKNNTRNYTEGQG
jgi:hypothetical protein